jgi:lauroyl/myristoyl acyltransferase
MISTIEDYRNATTRLRNSVAQLAASLESDVTQMSEFLRYRATKQLFFPQHTADDLTFFLDTQYSIQLSAQLESAMARPLLLSQGTAEGNLDFVQQLGKQPYIFCTFHFGSYQMVGAMLRDFGFDFSVLTLKEGITPDMLHQGAAAEALDVLHADSPSVMLEMHNILSSGKSIMAFIDGNPDTITEADSKSYARIDLLGHTLLAKKGIPSLAYATGVPIIPIVSYRVGPEEVRVAFGAPIRPDRSQPRAAYVQRALQTCYGQLESYLLTRPEQWLYWRMIHNYLDLSSGRSGGQLSTGSGEPSHYTFNQERYELYQARQHAYLYDRTTQDAFTISPNLLKYLQHISKAPDPAAAVAVRINPTLLQELLSKQIMQGVYADPQS